MERRKFIESFPILSFLGIDFLKELPNFNTNDWEAVANLFPKNGNYIDLNSGSAGTMPIPVENALIESIKILNRKPVYQAWHTWQSNIKALKKNLANQINVKPDRIALNRNATEGLNTIISNIKLDAGEQIVFATHDYPNVIKQLKFKAKKEGLSISELKLDLSTASDDEIVETYRKAIDKKTSFLVLTHMTHREGKIMPVKKIIKLAHEKGIKVLLDGAQSFGHFDFDLGELNPDFYATSLHKWLNAPLGTGILYIKKGLETSLHFPLYPDQENTPNQYENLGTYAYSQWLGIEAACAFHQQINIHQKEKRLNELNRYWMNKLDASVPHTFAHHPNNKVKGISSVGFENKSIHSIVNKLRKEHQINTKAVSRNDQSSYLRISPNIFTTEEQLDRFIQALHQVVSEV